jgi:DNA-binding transcriptional LysR family regulator
MGKNAQMNWEDYRYFLALADTGSFSAAARELGVDHSTVARRVNALETTFGVRLIDRLPKSVMLTVDGKLVAEQGRQAVLAMQAVERERTTGTGQSYYRAKSPGIARTAS